MKLAASFAGLAGSRFVKVTGAPYRMPAHPWARAGTGQPFHQNNRNVLEAAPPTRCGDGALRAVVSGSREVRGDGLAGKGGGWEVSASSPARCWLSA